MDQTERSRQRLEADFWNALNRRRDQRERPEPAAGSAGSDGDQAAGAAGLKQKIEQATAHRLNNSLSLMATSIFRLAPQQWRTLEAGGMTPEQASLLSGLDYRIKAVGEYDANDPLEVNASPPESPEGWKR